PLDNRDVVFQQFTNEVGGAVNGSIRGGDGRQTVYTQDGFDLKGQSPTLKSVSAYEISVGGYGAENAMASGGLINLVSRSGSNKHEFEFNGTLDSSALRFFTDGGDAAAPSYFYVINPAFSGPIIKDKLWYAFNMETLVYQFGRDKDPNGYLPDPNMNGKI